MSRFSRSPARSFRFLWSCWRCWRCLPPSRRSRLSCRDSSFSAHFNWCVNQSIIVLDDISPMRAIPMQIFEQDEQLELKLQESQAELASVQAKLTQFEEILGEV